MSITLGSNIILWERGQTYFSGNGRTVSATEATELEGIEFEIDDYIPTPNAPPSAPKKYRLQGAKVRLRICRNVSGATLYAKFLARFNKTAGVTPHCHVDGMSTGIADGPFAVIDEYLPSAGVPANDLFYVVIEGPTEFMTPLEGDAANVISYNDVLVSQTGATTGATTAGRVKARIAGALTTGTLDQITAGLGRAVSARTTGNTNSTLLGLLGKRYV